VGWVCRKDDGKQNPKTNSGRKFLKKMTNWKAKE
jgi:hypothetical protein